MLLRIIHFQICIIQVPSSFITGDIVQRVMHNVQGQIFWEHVGVAEKMHRQASLLKKRNNIIVHNLAILLLQLNINL